MHAAMMFVGATLYHRSALGTHQLMHACMACCPQHRRTWSLNLSTYSRIRLSAAADAFSTSALACRCAAASSARAAATSDTICACAAAAAACASCFSRRAARGAWHVTRNRHQQHNEEVTDEITVSQRLHGIGGTALFAAAPQLTRCLATHHQLLGHPVHD
jgi:hypothetical protein